MGIAALVQVVAQFLGELVDGELLRLVKAVLGDLPPVVPPVQHGLKVLELHGLGLGEVLVPLGHIQPVEPGFLGGVGMVEKKDVGGNGRIRRKHAARQADDGMEIELPQQFALDVHLGIIGAEQEAVGEDYRGPAVLLEPVHDDRHEQVRRFAAGQVGGKVVFDLRLFAAAIRRIHQHHVHLVRLGIVQHIAQEAIGMVHPGHIQPMEQQVGDAEHIGELLFFDAVDGTAVGLLGIGGGNLLFQLFQPADEKAAGTAGEV